MERVVSHKWLIQGDGVAAFARHPIPSDQPGNIDYSATNVDGGRGGGINLLGALWGEDISDESAD